MLEIFSGFIEEILDNMTFVTEEHASSDRFFSAGRVSLWLMCAAMVCIVALKPDRISWPHWNLIGWPLMGAGVLISLKHPNRNWFRTCVLLAYAITVLWFAAVDGRTDNMHVLELVLKLGVGILVVPALAAKYWLKEPLD